MPSFRQLMSNLAELESVPSRVATAAAAKIKASIDDQFSRGEDPYGVAWKALRPATLAKGRTPPPLTASGALRDSIRVTPKQGAGIEITIGVPYAGFHQTGTKNMVPRSILPDGSELPDEWTDAIEESFHDAVRRAG